MSDGRASISSYQPEAVKNNDIIQANNIQSNWQYRKYLTENADSVRKVDLIESMNDVGFYRRYADAPKKDNGTPYLYNSFVNGQKPTGYSNSDLKDLYISREQLEARKVSPVITQEELLKIHKQR
jgi:hypothetical protein